MEACTRIVLEATSKYKDVCEGLSEVTESLKSSGHDTEDQISNINTIRRELEHIEKTFTQEI